MSSTLSLPCVNTQRTLVKAATLIQHLITLQSFAFYNSWKQPVTYMPLHSIPSHNILQTWRSNINTSISTPNFSNLRCHAYLPRTQLSLSASCSLFLRVPSYVYLHTSSPCRCSTSYSRKRHTTYKISVAAASWTCRLHVKACSPRRQCKNYSLFMALLPLCVRDGNKLNTSISTKSHAMCSFITFTFRAIWKWTTYRGSSE